MQEPRVLCAAFNGPASWMSDTDRTGDLEVLLGLFEFVQSLAKGRGYIGNGLSSWHLE